jgi:hypothetical protein
MNEHMLELSFPSQLELEDSSVLFNLSIFILKNIRGFLNLLKDQ